MMSVRRLILLFFFMQEKQTVFLAESLMTREVAADVGAVFNNQRHACPRPVASSDPLQLYAAHSLS